MTKRDRVDQHAPLRHHGDVDAAPGLLDFAVNVRLDRPPAWLRDRLVAAVGELGRYPAAQLDDDARRAVAERHGRKPDEVLVLAGAAEGIALLPALRPRLAAVLQPSFTEPELALAAAGVPLQRVVLRAEDGYRLRPELVGDEPDLVVLGNPTNPTSVLHPSTLIRTLARPGRIVLVDEAFADAVPGETHSMTGVADLPGLLVLRSLTKTWGLAGLRAGYLLGAPDLLARLARPRPPWPVSSLALEAVRACSTPAAVAEAAAAAIELAGHREYLAGALAGLPGVRVHTPAHGPFLLVHVPDGIGVRKSLRAMGIAVRRADTFPGLTANHLRITVRSPRRCQPLLDALRMILIEGRAA